jgi:hypothetical protein
MVIKTLNIYVNRMVILEGVGRGIQGTMLEQNVVYFMGDSKVVSS